MEIAGDAILGQAQLTLHASNLHHILWYSDKTPPGATHMGYYTTK